MPQYRQDVQSEKHTQSFSLSTNYTATQSNLSIVTNPGRHKSIVVTDLIASAGAAGYLTLEQDTQVQQTIITQRLNLAVNGLITANYSNGLRLTANTDLGLNATTDDFSLTLEGYIENVTTYGYISGGGAQNVYKDEIQKFSFAANSNAVSVGDLTEARSWAAGQSSTVSGYTSGGQNYAPLFGSDRVDKFSFASDGDATDVGNLTQEREGAAGQSSITHGYTSGGIDGTAPVTRYDIIDKFSFTSDGNSTGVGDMTAERYYLAGQSSSTHGYTAAGSQRVSLAPDRVATIDKFSFASDGNATSIGDLSETFTKISGQSSPSHGYTSGGHGSQNPNLPPLEQIGDSEDKASIEKFSFASDGNGALIAELTTARDSTTGTSSLTHGYAAGGRFEDSDIPFHATASIDKFSFASDENSVDSGNLTTAAYMYAAAGQQS
jgi:hypothetical protein